MKSNLLLAGPILLSVALCSGSTLSVVVKILEFLGLVGLLATKSAAVVSLGAWLASSLAVVTHQVLGDSHCLAFAVLHGAIWLVRAFLLTAVFSGRGK
ncbi:MAG TPA: hypothetical protein VMU53_20070 [Candidatus Sulfotelmatobacter sp.]|nr:hypothetical protein [Candidatus Sulfotelmatobacter sp.]